MSGISNDQIYAAVMSLKEDVGGLKNAQSNMTQYIGAVSRKADDIRADLTTHKDNQEAHGAGGTRHTWSTIVTWATLGLAALEIALGIKSRH